MNHRSILVGLLLLVPFALAVAEDDHDHEMVTLTLPKGDPAAGRAAFQSLGCTTCHRVADEDFPKPTSDTPGPTLGANLGQQTAAYIGMSIFEPSHDIRASVRGNAKVSPMSDFTDVITIGQFMDVIAYLQSLR